MNENAINDPRYSQYRQQEKERKDNEKSPFSYLTDRFKRKIGLTIIKQGLITLATKTGPWGPITIIIVLVAVALIYIFFLGAKTGKSLEPEPELPIGDGSISEPIVEGLTISKIGDS